MTNDHDRILQIVKKIKPIEMILTKNPSDLSIPLDIDLPKRENSTPVLTVLKSRRRLAGSESKYVLAKVDIKEILN